MMTALTIAGAACLVLCIVIRGRMIADETERAEAAEGEAYLARLASKLEAGSVLQANTSDWAWVTLNESGGVDADPICTFRRRTEPRGVNIYPDEDLPSVARGAGILGPEDLT